MIRQRLSQIVAEVEVTVSQKVIGDVNEGIDPASSDPTIITFETCGGGGQEIADLKDLDRAIRGEECLQRGHCVGECLQCQIATGGRSMVPIITSIWVDGDHGQSGDVSQLAVRHFACLRKHEFLNCGLGLRCQRFALFGDDPCLASIQHPLFQRFQGRGHDGCHRVGLADSNPGGDR